MVDIFTGSTYDLKTDNPSLEDGVEGLLDAAKNTGIQPPADGVTIKDGTQPDDVNATLGELDKIIFQDIEGSDDGKGAQELDIPPDAADDIDSLGEDEAAEQPEEIQTITDQQRAEYRRIIDDNRKQIRNVVDQLNVYSSAVPQAPTTPTVDEAENPGEWAQYRADLAAHKAQKVQYDAQFKAARARIDQINNEQIATFSQYHKPEEVQAFGRWLSASPEMQDAIRYGSKDIDTVYKFYQVENNIQPSAPAPETERQRAAAQKYTAPKTTRGTATRVSQTPFSDKFKQEAQNLRNATNPVTGKRFSAMEVERMLKLDYATRPVRGGY